MKLKIAALLHLTFFDVGWPVTTLAFFVEDEIVTTSEFASFLTPSTAVENRTTLSRSYVTIVFHIARVVGVLCRGWVCWKVGISCSRWDVITCVYDLMTRTNIMNFIISEIIQIRLFASGLVIVNGHTFNPR